MTSPSWRNRRLFSNFSKQKLCEGVLILACTTVCWERKLSPVFHGVFRKKENRNLKFFGCMWLIYSTDLKINNWFKYVQSSCHSLYYVEGQSSTFTCIIFVETVFKPFKFQLRTESKNSTNINMHPLSFAMVCAWSGLRVNSFFYYYFHRTNSSTVDGYKVQSM